ncbi:hypothetical protein DIJ64_00865 [Mycobacterium leprae]|uniref:Carbamoyl phosphate synthase ATP-binding domain-containing protein n=1 Tax=Mycobacterium leprae TaxID=1769 RepID=A0AAD0KTP3_MYCLR|nr:hypothetical protein [Mycobacterium leprae]AWV47155.1 hypothetical protein DIJ64_00865 [Mycobacterium leprae]
MNARLLVEQAVTEENTELNLAELQLTVAYGNETLTSILY